MNRCLQCGRVLTDSGSIARHVGPECWAISRASRSGKNPVSLDKAVDRIHEFMDKAARYLDDESLVQLRAAAKPLIERILGYSESVRSETLWEKVTKNRATIADQMEQSINHLAGLAGELAGSGNADWRRSAEVWRPILGALDAACGFQWIKSGTHLRLARLHRQGTAISTRSKGNYLPLLDLLTSSTEEAAPEPMLSHPFTTEPIEVQQPQPILSEKLCAPLNLTLDSAVPSSAVTTSSKTAWI